MALTKESMADYIQAATSSVTIETSGGDAATSGAQATARVFLEAFCQGIIDELTNNGVVTGVDSPTGDTHNLSIT